MIAKSSESETSLLSSAISWLERRLPESWSIERYETDGSEPISQLSLRTSSGIFGSIAVETRDSLSPREASNLLPGFGRTLRSMTAGTALLVVAPWLSRRTREILAEEGISYIDLTGNALVSLDKPPVYIETAGASRNPAPKSRGTARVRGPKAARLIRLLADVRPPYGVGELAEETGLAPGYVSQLLGTLYREALIERLPRGPVESVDLAGLLRRWANSYDVFKANEAETFIAPSGIERTLLMLAESPAAETGVALTGSIAAARLAPVAAPSMLLAYCDRPAALGEALRLLPATEGANVVFLKPFDPVVWERTSTSEGLRFAAPSQAVVDCLSGNGRMPAEGAALLDWMQANEDEWRLRALSQSRPNEQ